MDGYTENTRELPKPHDKTRHSLLDSQLHNRSVSLTNTLRHKSIEELGFLSNQELLNRIHTPQLASKPEQSGSRHLTSSLDRQAPPSEPQKKPEHEFSKVHVAQAWNGATNLKEDSVTTMARHDLVFCSPKQLKLQFDGAFEGEAKTFTPESIQAGLALRAQLREKNPNIKLLTELRYRDAKEGYLPDNSNSWLHENDERVQGYKGKGPQYWKLDFTKPELQDHIAAQAAAVVNSGVADGIMLDWFNDGTEPGEKFDKGRRQLVDKIRKAIGPDALILVNTNSNEMHTELTRQVNGYYMENTRSQTKNDWDQIAKTLDFAERTTRAPHINIVETWFDDTKAGRNQVNKMRATVGLAMTHAPDAYSLFGDPDGYAPKEHQHDWYKFYDTPVGNVKGPKIDRPDGSTTREYQNGTVVYNPLGNHPVTIDFKDVRKSSATGKSGRRFTVNAEDADIFIRQPE